MMMIAGMLLLVQCRTDGHYRRSEILEQGTLRVLQLLEPFQQVIVGGLQLLEALGHFAILENCRRRGQ